MNMDEHGRIWRTFLSPLTRISEVGTSRWDTLRVPTSDYSNWRDVACSPASGLLAVASVASAPCRKVFKVLSTHLEEHHRKCQRSANSYPNNISAISNSRFKDTQGTTQRMLARWQGICPAFRFLAFPAAALSLESADPNSMQSRFHNVSYKWPRGLWNCKLPCHKLKQVLGILLQAYLRLLPLLLLLVNRS